MNPSRHQLRDLDPVDTVADTLPRQHTARGLCLEITEGTMLDDLPSTEKALNELKIDRSFVSGVGASSEDAQSAPSSPHSRRRLACARPRKASMSARADA